MALAVNALKIVKINYIIINAKKRVYIESAMPSAMSHLHRILHLRAYNSLS